VNYLLQVFLRHIECLREVTYHTLDFGVLARPSLVVVNCSAE